MNTIYEKIHDLLNEKNVPEYRFNQILHSIFKQRIGKYEDMKTLPQSIREMLISEFGSTVYGVRHLKMIWVKSEKCSLNYAMGTR